MGKLTALGVKRAKSGRHSDGDGLYLVVDEKGNAKWVLRIQVNGRRRDIGLGSARSVTLAAARESADEMRKGYGRGEDPVELRRKAKITLPTFKEAAEAVHKERKPGWKNGKHTDQWIRTLEIYAYPRLGDLQVHKIDSALIRDVLAEIWLKIPETARRVRQRIGIVLDYCHAKGWRETEAPMRSVSRGLPRQSDRRGHFEAMPWAELPTFLANMQETLSAEEKTLLLLEFTILTATRSGESRGARWSEIDRQKRVWTIPPERMKNGLKHRVPLTKQALDILDRMQELRRTKDKHALIFEGMKLGKPMSDATLTRPLRRAGLSITIHGFRSTFRDWAEDNTRFSKPLIEKVLAHTVKDKTERAYHRTDSFENRRKLMDAWASYCNRERTKGANVVPLKKKGA
ncbi:MAG: tyrosine-type recombinase/integrase [Kiloniellaceae bacterium]